MAKRSARKSQKKSQKRRKAEEPQGYYLSTELDAYESLSEPYKQIVEMRLLGYKYRQIHEYLKTQGIHVGESTVGWWFTPRCSGRIYKAWMERKAMRAKEDEAIFAEAAESLRALVGEALVVVRNHLARNNLDAAIHILRVTGFVEAKKPVEAADSPALGMISELIDIERKKLEEAKPDERNVTAK